MDMDDLKKRIDRKKPDVERRMVQTRGEAPRIRTRERDPDEQRILDKLCIKRWKQAEQAGKIKYISKTEWYYELD
ncbi:hypothetical protein JNUCC1_01421 [Lentibacillus sp. JNUCC-1]|uniref:hypothetical protein n=1 Tax=Lentibacillus sp. JNUCC-1 TaxID=2654513 RepID=UPI0012E8A204|nr:hypothetical protein [Lentibacillus sp. JNUCC-1]MUV37615.1 hypothetical protein [Lentibacillus sp. JNUCC-1]